MENSQSSPIGTNVNKFKPRAGILAILLTGGSTILLIIAAFCKFSYIWFFSVCGLWYGCVLPIFKSFVKGLLVHNDNLKVGRWWWAILGFVIAFALILFLSISAKLPKFNLDIDKESLAWFTFVYLLVSNVMGSIFDAFGGEWFAKYFVNSPSK